MFAYTGLNADMVKELREKHHIYLVNSGRISIAGINTKNVKYIAEAFHKVTDGKKL
jgi:aspartate/tyrosine/aromatic aminotransferase